MFSALISISVFDLAESTKQLTNVYLLWGAADAEIKVQSDENTEFKVLPFKPGVGQYIAMHATLTARDFFLANFYPSGPFTCILSETSPELFLC